MLKLICRSLCGILVLVGVMNFSLAFGLDVSREQNQSGQPSQEFMDFANKAIAERRQKAIELRDRGLQLQQEGNFAAALNMYSEAIKIDDSYADLYCDLGVIYETGGDTDEAEKLYLRAQNINPNCLTAYSNLAMLYESKKDFDRAILCWQKRANLGDPDDPWVQKAKLKVPLLEKSRQEEQAKEKTQVINARADELDDSLDSTKEEIVAFLGKRQAK